MNARTPTAISAIPVLLLAGCGTDVSGPSGSLFSCMLEAPLSLETGEVVQVAGAGNRGLCLTGGEAGAEFVYIPFFATTPREDETLKLPVELLGAGFRAVTGPPMPSPPIAAPGAGGAVIALGETPQREPVPREDARFHDALRESEARELGSLLRRGAAGMPSSRRAPAADVPAPGDLLTFNVAISCTQEDLRTGRVEHVSERSIVVADIENPAGLTAVDYRHFALTFDTLVDPIEIAHFGEPSDIDENDRSILFFTRAVNELSSSAEGTFTAGFFWSGDLFPETTTDRAEACPAANQAEMFYLLSADPAGVAGPAFSVDFVREAAVGIIGHEYQHLINAARRLWVNDALEFERPWLNEALSHAAEELLFYAVSGLEPGTNIDRETLGSVPAGAAVFNRYMAGNFTNYARYLERPDTASLMGADGLQTRGAAWNFLRYAADRSGRAGEVFFQDVVNARVAGLENLQEVFGEDPLVWMQDWTVSVYADDAVEVQDRYTQPSWNLRNLYLNSTIERFPLTVLSIGAGDSRVIDLQPGGTGFPRFGLDAGQAGVLHVTADDDEPPGTLRGSFLRTR